MRLGTRRGDQYDPIDSSGVYLFIPKGGFYSTDGTSSWQKLVSQHSPINPMVWFSWIWFFG
jgi:hypothetical protein